MYSYYVLVTYCLLKCSAYVPLSTPICIPHAHHLDTTYICSPLNEPNLSLPRQRLRLVRNIVHFITLSRSRLESNLPTCTYCHPFVCFWRMVVTNSRGMTPLWAESWWAKTHRYGFLKYFTVARHFFSSRNSLLLSLVPHYFFLNHPTPPAAPSIHRKPVGFAISGVSVPHRTQEAGSGNIAVSSLDFRLIRSRGQTSILLRSIGTAPALKLLPSIEIR